MASTYEKIATSTASGSASSVTFSSISGSYTDLVLITNAKCASNTSLALRVGNGSVDTGSNYSVTVLNGNGSAAQSARDTNTTYGFVLGLYVQITAGNEIETITHFQNYSNTTTYKTWLNRGNVPAQFVDTSVALWRSTSAINTIQVLTNTGANISAGSTFTIYGIKAA
jgi:hypothetical protein